MKTVLMCREMDLIAVRKNKSEESEMTSAIDMCIKGKNKCNSRLVRII